MRIYHGGPLLGWTHLNPLEPPRVDSSDPSYDRLLGFVPLPGTHTDSYGISATIDSDRLRAHPGTRAAGATILAIGDSFTFCNEVSDDETWPYRLEHLTRRRVLNAGVGGYGLDQAVLRGETLIAHYKPELVILGVISDDVRRSEMSYLFGKWKPYFELVNGELALRNVPVAPLGRDLSMLHELFGPSYLFRAIASRTAPDWWYVNRSYRAHRGGKEVATLLIERLSRLADEHHFRLLIVALARDDLLAEGLAAPMQRARELRLEVLDLRPEIIRMAKAAPDQRTKMFRPEGHLAADMNRWVAERVADALALDRS